MSKFNHWLAICDHCGQVVGTRQSQGDDPPSCDEGGYQIARKAPALCQPWRNHWPVTFRPVSRDEWEATQSPHLDGEIGW